MHPALLVLTLILTLAACAPPPASTSAPSAATGEQAAPSAPSAPKRVNVIVFREMDFLPNNSFPGSPDVRHLVNPGVSVLDDRGLQQPLLVEAVPSLENGLWKLLPDGRMETTWRLKSGVRWHDGEPFTSDDLVFTTQLGQDRSTGAFGHAAFSSVEGVTAPDAQTITVTWKQPYVDADQLFTVAFGYPLPRHLLESPYQQDKTSLIQLPYWTSGYVGSGPYRVKDFVPGNRIELQAFEQYAPGKPKIDELDLIYIPDPNTALANLLSGTADLTVGIGLPIESALEMRDRWHDGKVSFEFSDHRWYVIDPQFMDPTPAIIGDLRFRRAMLHAIDRQELAETLQAGLSPVAHTFMAPNQPDYKVVEDRVIRYEYDPRKAAQMIEELGYSKGADGVYHDAAGRPLEVDIQGSSDSVQKPMLAVAGYWQRLGIPTTSSVVPAQRAADWPWRAQYPSFAMFTGTNDLEGLPALFGNRARTAENNYEVSGIPNWPRYRNAELDGMVTRFFSTIPKNERIQVLSDINEHIAQNLNLMGLYYFPTPYGIANRLTNIPINRGSRASIAWNAQTWDTK